MLFDQSLGAYMGFAFVGVLSPFILAGLVGQGRLDPGAAIVIGVVAMALGVVGAIFTVVRFRELRAESRRRPRAERRPPRH